MAGPQLALVLKAEKTANRAFPQAAISLVLPIERDHHTQEHLHDSLKENVEPSYMREIAPPRLVTIIQKQSFSRHKNQRYFPNRASKISFSSYLRILKDGCLFTTASPDRHRHRCSVYLAYGMRPHQEGLSQWLLRSRQHGSYF